MKRGGGCLHRFLAPGTRALRRASFDGRSETDGRHPLSEGGKKLAEAARESFLLAEPPR